jgi:legumain
MPDDKVDGKEIRSCLGDLYSVNWMEDTDKKIAGESLEVQYETVVAATTKSHVMQFGTSTVSLEPLTNFQGATDGAKLLANAATKSSRELDASRVETVESESTPSASAPDEKTRSAMDSRHTELFSALSRYVGYERDEDAEELITALQDRMASKKRFNKISLAVSGKLATAQAPAVVDTECHYAAHKHYVAACGEWSMGALKHSATLASLCASTGGDVEPIKAAISNAC